MATKKELEDQLGRHKEFMKFVLAETKSRAKRFERELPKTFKSKDRDQKIKSELDLADAKEHLNIVEETRTKLGIAVPKTVKVKKAKGKNEAKA